MMQDRRQPSTSQPLSPQARDDAKSRLEAEIRLIRGWLEDLNETREDNAESMAARKTYHDMLRSRNDLLEILEQKKKKA